MAPEAPPTPRSNIYCRVYDHSDLFHPESEKRATCYARDVEGTTRACTFIDERQIALAESIGDATYIEFTWRDLDPWGTHCDYFEVRHGSPHED